MPTVQPVTSASMSGALNGAAPKIVAASQPKKNIMPAVLGVAAALFLILSGVFMWLFVSKNNEYAELSDEVDLKIAAAVSEAKAEQALADAEEAKKDTRQFTGPTDYGQLSFDFPKMWSVYVASDASKGGDFVAYLNPLEIEPVSDSTVYALRVTIVNKGFESVTADYQRYLERDELSMTTVTVGGTTANRYVGKIPGTELNGIIVVLKIRDKTAILRTDAMGYEGDFQTILDSVKFNA